MPNDSNSPEQREIQQLIDGWISAQCDRDIDRLMAFYASDAVLFGLTPPWTTCGAAAWREIWAERLPHFPAEFSMSVRDLTIVADSTLALAHWQFRYENLCVADPAARSWIRVSAGYRKIDGNWRVVHEHYSFPYDPIAAEVVFSLE